MFSGGGTLVAALKTGLEQGGATVSVAGLIELEAKYLGIAAKAHPEASTWSGSAAEWHPAEMSVPKSAMRIFSAGIPCTGASRAGISKNGLDCAEDHEEVGALFLNVLHYVRQHRPEMVVLECVDTYRNTMSVRCIRDALSASGYTFDERIVNPLKEFATPSQRKRWIVVASRVGRFTWMYEAKGFVGTLAPYLDRASSEDAAESATPEQVQADAKYCARKKAEGCGFAAQIVDASSDRCGTRAEVVRETPADRDFR